MGQSHLGGLNSSSSFMQMLVLKCTNPLHPWNRKLSRIDNLVSVNSALRWIYMGRLMPSKLAIGICAIGGQVDFMCRFRSYARVVSNRHASRTREFRSEPNN